jgi:hydrogenase nickel incorporation protein HypA/HybF
MGLQRSAKRPVSVMHPQPRRAFLRALRAIRLLSSRRHDTIGRELEMHELPVTKGMLSIALEHAAKAGAKKITRINLLIGEMSGIVDDSVQFYFDFVSKDTAAEGATLSFERVPACFRCRACETTFSPSDREWTCPQCGELSMEIVAGREFYVDSIEVE